MKKQTIKSRTVKGKYVDGFLLVVPKNKINEYKKAARFMAKLCKKYGALDYKECIGEDMRPKTNGMNFTYFPKVVNARPNETVWFSFIVYKSRKHRDDINAMIMKDPAMNDSEWTSKPMPFDMKRMAYGGFKVEVDA